MHDTTDSLPPRCLAIVPAAGHSRRMGQSKLLMPWGEGTVIDAVLRAWNDSQCHQVVVVVRGEDQQLIDVCRRWPIQLVTPATDPPDMKASVQLGLQYLMRHADPVPSDHCFIAPADLPTLSTAVINRLIDAIDGSGRIVVPQFGDRPGHPVLLPWPLVQQIFALRPDQGINRIVERHDKLRVPFPADARIGDIDTPQQYQEAQHQQRKTGTK